jgi:mitochondrial fission protein ELM1
VDRQNGKLEEGRRYLGVLIGGSTKGYVLTAGAVDDMVGSVLEAAERLDALIVVTTSRRTPRDVEETLKERLGTHPRCAMLIIANESNIPEAVGGILGLSSCVVTTPDSISMMSEAAASGKYVVVSSQDGVSAKHRRFIRRYAQMRYAYVVNDNREIGALAERLLRERPEKKMPMDRRAIREALERIL